MNSLYASKNRTLIQYSMARVDSFSLRQKLILIMLTVSSIAILLSASTIIAYQYSNFKLQMMEDISTKAKMVSINSQVPLAFNDVEDANLILSSLQTVPSIAYAALYRENGELFTSYQKEIGVFTPEFPPGDGKAIFRQNWLLATQGIFLGENEQIGILFIQSDTADLELFLTRSLFAVLIIVLAVLILCYFLASSLQSYISAPIIALTKTASLVTKNQDYSAHMEVLGDDELGVLFEAFNVMMENISQRDKALAGYRENLEQLVLDRTKQLEKAHAEIVNKEKLAALGQLTATVAHEIRNPLGTLRTSVYALGEAVENKQTDRIKRIINLSEKSIKRCDNIISELLDYTRTRKLRLESTNIDDWLNEFMDIQNIPKDIHCIRRLDSSLVLDFDLEHLRRAIANIVTNGVQALQDKEGDDKRLEIETRVTDSKLEIIVTDNGEGISEAQMHKIFEPLYSNKTYGVGLGLPIVKGIMTDHKGGISISSEFEKSTKVILWLPTNLGMSGGDELLKYSVNT